MTIVSTLPYSVIRHSLALAEFEMFVLLTNDDDDVDCFVRRLRRRSTSKVQKTYLL